MEPGSRTHSGGYANNPPPGMGHTGRASQQEWSLSNQMGRGEEWSRGSPHSVQQNSNVEQWGVGAVGERRPSSMSAYSWSLSNDMGGMRGDLGMSSSPHVNGSLDNMESYMGGIDASSFSTSFPAIFQDKRKWHPRVTIFCLPLGLQVF